MTVRPAHSLIDIVQHRLLKCSSCVASSVDQVVCVDDAYDMLELIDPRLFNEWSSVPSTFKNNKQQICDSMIQ